MDNIEKGFENFISDLQAISSKVTDNNLRKEVLEAAAKPIAIRARNIASRVLNRRSGRLFESIGYQYSDKMNSVRIGIGEPVSVGKSSTGYYGRFQNDGWRPAGGRRVGKVTSRGGRQLDKRSARPVGTLVRGKNFLGGALDIEESNVYRTMLEKLEKALL